MGPAGSEPERDPVAAASIDLPEVTLVAATGSGSGEVHGLRLCFDEQGLTVRKGGGELVVLIGWPLLRSVKVPSDHRAARGIVDTVGLIVQSDRRRHRFVVHRADPRVLTAGLSAVSKRYGGRDLTRVPDAAGG
jgi:hypothetical protein